jgi:hypothetical protein
VEEIRGGLAQDDRAGAARVLERLDERRHVEAQPVGGTPVAGHAERDERRPRLAHEKAEGAVQRVEVPACAQISKHHGRGARFRVRGQAGRVAELGSRRFGNEERRGSRGLLGEPVRRRSRRSEDVVGIGLDAEPCELVDQRAAGARGRVGEEEVRDSPLLEPGDGLRSARHRALALVDHAVEIDEGRPHGILHPAIFRSGLCHSSRR